MYREVHVVLTSIFDARRMRLRLEETRRKLNGKAAGRDHVTVGIEEGGWISGNTLSIRTTSDVAIVIDTRDGVLDIPKVVLP